MKLVVELKVIPDNNYYEVADLINRLLVPRVKIKHLSNIKE